MQPLGLHMASTDVDHRPEREGNGVASGAALRASWHIVAQFGEAGADRSRRHETKRRVGDHSWEEWLPRPERDGGDLHVDLVEQAGVVELANELPTANEPDVLAAGRVQHRLVHRSDVTADEPDVRPGHGGERA